MPLNIKAGSKSVFRNILLMPFLLLLLTFSYLIYHTPEPNLARFEINQQTECSNKVIVNASMPNKSHLCTKKQQFSAELIPQPEFLSAAHAATLELLPNGNLLALWFAGSHEGKPDVKIWQSEFDGDTWSMAKAVVTPELLIQTTDQFVKKVGNPVVYLAKDGTLHLFVVSVSLIGGWSASNINHFSSIDMAKTWQGGKRLMLSPFFNLSTLVRTNAISLDDGGFYLPVYHELIRKYAELLRFDNHGNFIQQIRISGNKNLLQPTILALTNIEAMAFMRNYTRVDKRLYYQVTDDGGMSWLEPEATNITNQDSSLVVANIAPQSYLMVHNNGDRSHLALAVSSNGEKWQDIYFLEGAKDQEFSYPALKVHDGLVDVLYTRNRTAIKHVRFNLSWLKNQIHQGKTDVN